MLKAYAGRRVLCQNSTCCGSMPPVRTMRRGIAKSVSFQATTGEPSRRKRRHGWGGAGCPQEEGKAFISLHHCLEAIPPSPSLPSLLIGWSDEIKTPPF